MTDAPQAAPVATPVEYRPNDQAEAKIKELLLKKEEYLGALTKIDEMLMQLRYGISQKIGDGKARCNGFSVGFDMSDYSCRELCEKNLQSACKTIVLAKNAEQEKEDDNPYRIR